MIDEELLVFNYVILLLVWVAAFVISVVLCRVFIGLGKKGVMLDAPNARSLHAVPVPRSGGSAIAVALLPGFLVVIPAADSLLAAIAVGWLLVFAVSLLDDQRGLSATSRILVHVVAASLVLFSGHDGRPFDAPFELLFGLFWIVWGTNLFNFMDGMDGLAASMSVIGGSALGVALLMTGWVYPALLLGAVVSATAGFLWFNRPPARIFMGDSGAAPLGFLFAAFAVSGVQREGLPGWLPVLVFLPFIADASFTLLRRTWQRKRIWQAHREHAYQLLVLEGWAVRNVLIAEGIAMAICGIAAFAAGMSGPGYLLLSIALLLFGGMYCVIIWKSLQEP